MAPNHNLKHGGRAAVARARDRVSKATGSGLHNAIVRQSITDAALKASLLAHAEARRLGATDDDALIHAREAAEAERSKRLAIHAIPTTSDFAALKVEDHAEFELRKAIQLAERGQR
jgi:hypothetical protein